MACRDLEKAQRAADEMENDLEQSSLELLALDLSDLVSVRRAAEQFVAEHARLDLLINNAGVMGTPYRQTADGFELQMATNHLGHFALTGLLLDRLLTSGRSRVVTVSSLMHRNGHIDFDDVAGLKIRNTWPHYGASKLANLLFTAELSRRLLADGETTIAVAAHPGWTRSNLFGTGAALGQRESPGQSEQNPRVPPRAGHGHRGAAHPSTPPPPPRSIRPVHRTEPCVPALRTADGGPPCETGTEPRLTPPVCGRSPKS